MIRISSSVVAAKYAGEEDHDDEDGVEYGCESNQCPKQHCHSSGTCTQKAEDEGE